MLPVYLLGAMAVFVSADFSLSPTQLGLSVSAFSAAEGVGALFCGRLVERLGGRRALAYAAGGGAASLAGIALASNWGLLLLWLAWGGLMNNLSQLGSNLRISQGVGRARQGLAFGLKQSSAPMAALLGGLAVPTIALTSGWRWVFASAASSAVFVSLTLARRVRGGDAIRARGAKPHLAKAPLLLLSVGFGLGAGAAGAMSAFVIVYGVSEGMGAGAVGLVLAAGSLAAALSRVVLGSVADRHHRGHLATVAVMMMMAALTVGSYPFTSSAVSIATVTIVAYAVGWGWPGLLNMSVVRYNPHAPAAATGVTQVGACTGSVVGPLAFGLITSHASYGAAWFTMSGWLVAGALSILGGRLLAKRAWPIDA
jgi:MFS family permease